MTRLRGLSTGVACCLFPAVLVGLPLGVSAQEPCSEVLTRWARLAEVLPGVPLYDTTYTLVYPDRLSDQIPSVDAPSVRELQVGVYEGSPGAEVATRLGLENVRAYAFEQDNPGQLIAELLAENLDAAIVWAPLAGLAVMELDLDYTLSLLTTGPPSDPPSIFETAAASGEAGECEGELSSFLEGFGVVPAQQLVPVDIRDFLRKSPPAPDLALAREGAPLYEEHCAKCHGSQAVADPNALAPVEVMKSIRRFTYPGFFYIALNGRAQNGMPGFRGKLGEEELSRIYQYVRARSHGDLQPSLPLNEATESEPGEE